MYRDFGWPEPYNSTSVELEAGRLVASGQCRLVGMTVMNTKAAVQYIQLFDTNTQPANGAIPMWVRDVQASVGTDWEWLWPRVFRNGIWIANSSTVATLTAGSADCYFDVQWVPYEPD